MNSLMGNTENLGSAQRGIMKVNEVEKREKLYIVFWFSSSALENLVYCMTANDYTALSEIPIST